MASAKRFEFIDGLRGVAAMMVVFYHFAGNLPEPSLAVTPRVIETLFHYGNLGVDIFFVLSGFVIAHSVRNAAFSPSYILRFGVRRSIRLDPPLWVTIIAELVLIRIGLLLLPSLGTRVPSAMEALINATYLQRFLGVPDVVPVFWSLTYEVQFYLVLVISLTLLKPRTVGPSGRRVASAVFALSIIYSLMIWLQIMGLPLRGLFIDRWFQFALGATAWAYTRGMVSTWALGGSLLGVGLAAIPFAPTSYRLGTILVTVLTAASLAYAGRQDKMYWLSGSVLQFLGRISYSLYLLHLPIGWRIMTLAKLAIGDEISPLMGYVSFALGIVTSVVAAWLMYRLLEAPSIRLARRINLPTLHGPQANTVALVQTPP